MADERAYTIVVDVAAAQEQMPLDGLQRVGARILLLGAVPGAMRQFGLETQLIDADVSVAGAVVVVQFPARSLEAAEQSARLAVRSALDTSPDLSAWQVVSSEPRFDLLRQNYNGL